MNLLLKIVGIICLVAGGYLVFEASAAIISGEITLNANSEDFVVLFEKNPKIYLASVISYYFGGAILFWCGKATFKDSQEISNALRW
ncbi:hypothetical protein ACNKU7_18760 [Microbulbifer sp. SA54]|uniref:hypothetical protein n=1 Tax=Microbulbifer sp. SA54 TaxID=3401577 RepID=UPI003AAF39EE